MTCYVLRINLQLVSFYKMSQLFDEKYYREIKFFATITGRWPYQPKKQRHFIEFLIFMFSLIEIIGEIIAVVVFRHDKELVLESISPFLIDIAAFAKYSSHIYHSEKVKYIYDQMKESWRFHASPSEQKVLRKYTDIGIAYVWVFIVGSQIVTFLFTAEPLLPRFVNFLLNKNETVPKRYPVPVYWFGINMAENYYYTLSYSILCIWIIITVEVSSDMAFIIMSQHAAALFEVTGCILENIPTEEDYQKEQKQKNHISLENLRYQHYMKCIKSHQRAIQFTKSLETINVWPFGLILTLNIPILSVTATQITTQAENIQQILKYSTFAFIQLFHAFALCALSQQLITNSTLIQKSAIGGLWYECDPKTQKLLTMVMMRSQRECGLKAGKLLIISMETFTTITKTATSYFTMLAQTRSL